MYLEIDKISKQYKDIFAVKQLEFSADAGEFITLLGPSGCGKTTTLRMIAGLETTDEGDIQILGKSIVHIPPWDRDLGVVFQNYALFHHMSVYENVAFGLEMRKLNRMEIESRVKASLKLVGLEKYGDQFPRQLSGGQQQRVALSRALVLKPDVLLLDEPLSNLDAKLRTEMRFEMKQLQHEINVTTIYVTHDQEEALTLSDFIIVMNEAEIVQSGTPQDIWENPANEFVADFLGVENLLEGKFLGQKKDGIFSVRLDGMKDPLVSYKRNEKFGSGDDIVMGIRSGDIQLFEEKPKILKYY